MKMQRKASSILKLNTSDQDKANKAGGCLGRQDIKSSQLQLEKIQVRLLSELHIKDHGRKRHSRCQHRKDFLLT